MVEKSHVCDDNGVFCRGCDLDVLEAEAQRTETRYYPCGCPAPGPHDEAKHLANAIKAADAQCWAAHESAVADA